MVATDPLDSGTYTIPKITKKNSGSVMVTECKKKGKLIMENRKFTINGESNPKKCGVFDEFYESGASEYSGINVLEDGTLRIDFLAKIIVRVWVALDTDVSKVVNIRHKVYECTQCLGHLLLRVLIMYLDNLQRLIDSIVSVI